MSYMLAPLSKQQFDQLNNAVKADESSSLKEKFTKDLETIAKRSMWKEIAETGLDPTDRFHGSINFNEEEKVALRSFCDSHHMTCLVKLLDSQIKVGKIYNEYNNTDTTPERRLELAKNMIEADIELSQLTVQFKKMASIYVDFPAKTESTASVFRHGSSDGDADLEPTFGKK